MKLLLDTQLLLWAMGLPERLPPALCGELQAASTAPVFSAASIWEIVIKSGLGRPDFKVDARLFRSALLEAGYSELPITGQHTLTVTVLPDIHKDPFDRILIAQAISEGIVFATADARLLGYPGPIRKI